MAIKSPNLACTMLAQPMLCDEVDAAFTVFATCFHLVASQSSRLPFSRSLAHATMCKLLRLGSSPRDSTLSLFFCVSLLHLVLEGLKTVDPQIADISADSRKNNLIYEASTEVGPPRLESRGGVGGGVNPSLESSTGRGRES